MAVQGNGGNGLIRTRRTKTVQPTGVVRATGLREQAAGFNDFAAQMDSVRAEVTADLERQHQLFVRQKLIEAETAIHGEIERLKVEHPGKPEILDEAIEPYIEERLAGLRDVLNPNDEGVIGEYAARFGLARVRAVASSTKDARRIQAVNLHASVKQAQADLLTRVRIRGKEFAERGITDFDPVKETSEEADLLRARLVEINAIDPTLVTDFDIAQAGVLMTKEFYRGSVIETAAQIFLEEGQDAARQFIESLPEDKYGLTTGEYENLQNLALGEGRDRYAQFSEQWEEQYLAFGTDIETAATVDELPTSVPGSIRGPYRARAIAALRRAYARFDKEANELDDARTMAEYEIGLINANSADEVPQPTGITDPEDAIRASVAYARRVEQLNGTEQQVARAGYATQVEIARTAEDVPEVPDTITDPIERVRAENSRALKLARLADDDKKVADLLASGQYSIDLLQVQTADAVPPVPDNVTDQEDRVRLSIARAQRIIELEGTEQQISRANYDVHLAITDDIAAIEPIPSDITDPVLRAAANGARIKKLDALADQQGEARERIHHRDMIARIASAATYLQEGVPIPANLVPTAAEWTRIKDPELAADVQRKAVALSMAQDAADKGAQRQALLDEQEAAIEATQSENYDALALQINEGNIPGDDQLRSALDAKQITKTQFDQLLASRRSYIKDQKPVRDGKVALDQLLNGGYSFSSVRQQDRQNVDAYLKKQVQNGAYDASKPAHHQSMRDIVRVLGDVPVAFQTQFKNVRRLGTEQRQQMIDLSADIAAYGSLGSRKIDQLWAELRVAQDTGAMPDQMDRLIDSYFDPTMETDLAARSRVLRNVDVESAEAAIQTVVADLAEKADVFSDAYRRWVPQKSPVAELIPKEGSLIYDARSNSMSWGFTFGNVAFNDEDDGIMTARIELDPELAERFQDLAQVNVKGSPIHYSVEGLHDQTGRQIAGEATISRMLYSPDRNFVMSRRAPEKFYKTTAAHHPEILAMAAADAINAMNENGMSNILVEGKINPAEGKPTPEWMMSLYESGQLYAAPSGRNGPDGRPLYQIVVTDAYGSPMVLGSGGKTLIDFGQENARDALKYFNGIPEDIFGRSGNPMFRGLPKDLRDRVDAQVRRRLGEQE